MSKANRGHSQLYHKTTAGKFAATVQKYRWRGHIKKVFSYYLQNTDWFQRCSESSVFDEAIEANEARPKNVCFLFVCKNIDIAVSQLYFDVMRSLFLSKFAANNAKVIAKN